MKENNRGDWGIMFNNINDNNNLLQFNNTSNIINLANVRSSLQKNTYTTSPLVDKTEISSNAMKLFQKDIDIKKFTQIAMDDSDDTSYLEEMEKLFSEGVTDPFEPDAMSMLVTNSKLWDDLNL